MTEPLRITRELLEHYLRAIGYVVVFDGIHRYRTRPGSHSIPDVNDSDALLQLAEDRIERDIRFRLGLCAAAEDDLARAAAIGRQYDILHDRSAQTARDELVAAANRKLGYADITPEQWEATR